MGRQEWEGNIHRCMWNLVWLVVYRSALWLAYEQPAALSAKWVTAPCSSSHRAKTRAHCNEDYPCILCRSCHFRTELDFYALSSARRVQIPLHVVQVAAPLSNGTVRFYAAVWHGPADSNRNLCTSGRQAVKMILPRSAEQRCLWETRFAEGSQVDAKFTWNHLSPDARTSVCACTMRVRDYRLIPC